MKLRNILSILILILVLGTALSISSISDFNINSNATATTSTSVTLGYNLTIDVNCEMCFSETNDSVACTSRSACSGSSSSFSLSSTNGTKTVYAFIYDNNVFTTQANNSIVLDNNKPYCSITSPTTTDFNSLSGIVFKFVCSDATSTIDQNYAKINGETIADGNTLNWLTANTIYSITVDANDSVGNLATQVTSTLKYDTNAPVPIQGTNFTANRYTNDTTPDLTFSSSETTTGWKVLLTCNKTGTWKESTFSTTINDFDITSSTYGCPTGVNSDRNIYAKFVDKAGNTSTTDINITIGYDTTNPDYPNGFNVVAGNTKATLSWNEPDEDNFSGNDRIEIYLNASKRTDVNYGTTTIDINNLTNGAEYDFKIRTKDKAGNFSDYTGEISITPQSTTSSISIDPQVEYVKNGTEITITCDFSETADNAYLYYRYATPSTTRAELDSGDNVDSLEVDFTINDSSPTKHEKIVFSCTADGSSGNDVSITIDNTNPTIEWTDSNNLFSGIKRIKAKANDNKYLSAVEFVLNNIVYAGRRDTDGNYYTDLNTISFENGSYVLKATSIDGAANKTEITRTITLDNYTSPKQLAEKAINETKIKQKTANDLINYYTAQALIVPNDLNIKKENADALLLQAQNELLTNPEQAKTDAIDAGNLFNEFNSSAVAQVKQTKTYISDLNNALEILQKYGLSAIDANAQISAMQSSGISRKLVIIQTGSSTNRQIKIEISFTNDTNSEIVKIVEVIPKELIDSAKKIISDTNFRIIQEDPVIEFTIPLAKGATTIISYGIGEMDSNKAQSMIDNNIITLFATAPIILDGNLTTEQLMPNLANGNSFLLLILGLLVILIIIALIILFIKFKMPGHGFGKEKTIIEHLTPEQEKAKKKFEAFKK